MRLSSNLQTQKHSYRMHINLDFLCRSWEKLCVVLKGSQIVFYKDHKTYRSKPEDTFRGELPVDLSGAEATVATDYTKKKHVFRLK